MKKSIIFTIAMAVMMIVMPAHAASLLKGYVLVNGEQVQAEYTKLTDNTVSVGSGKNACIPHYTAGHLTIPSEVTIDGTTYQVTQVSNVAFRLCNQLTGVEIRENVKRIGNFAFVGCSKLAEITLPASLESIGSGAFINTVTSQEAASVTCLGETPPRWEYNDVFAFHSLGIGDPNPSIVGANVEIYVPEGKEETYRTALFTNPEIGWTGADGWGAFSKFYTGVSSIHIYNNVDLLAVRDIVNNHGKYNFYKNIYLENDIDMNDAVWDWGIGNDETHPFEGNFHGNGHTISNLRIHNPNGPAGLFSYFGGKFVENVYLAGFDVDGTEAVGAFAGVSGYCDFLGVWVERSVYWVNDGYMGGILGKCLTTGGANFNQCVLKDFTYVYMTHSTSSETLPGGGIVGFAYGGNINDCAVIDDPACDYVKPFVGQCDDANIFNVKNSYAISPSYQGYTPASNVIYNDHVVLWGNKTYDVTHSNGQSSPICIDSKRNFASLMMVPALGLDNWIFQEGQHPLPVFFEDKMPVAVNKVSFKPMSRDSKRVNALMLGSGTPWTVFLDHSKNGYCSKTYFTHQLWIDDEFPYNADLFNDSPYTFPYLPIGTATITCWDGIRYDRKLNVTPAGTKPVTVPNIQVGDDGKPVIDSDGNYVTDGEVTLYEVPVFEPTGYMVYLPYKLHHNYTFRLFEPETVTVQGDKASLVVNEIDAEIIYPWTPYYMVVTDTPVDLGTSEVVTIEPEPEYNNIDFGPSGLYQMCGTKNPIQAQDRMFTIADLDDFKQATGTLPSWRSYFIVPEGINDLTITRELRFYENINNNVTIEDFDNTVVKATLRGRTFVKDGTWYTLCLPFDVSGDMGPLEGATICKLDGCTLDDGTLSIDFKQVTQVEAGVPYIIKWEQGDNIVNPSFYDVTIKDVGNKAIKAGSIYMAGNYLPIEVNEDSRVLYLGDNNRLYRPDHDMTINAFRACFYYASEEEMQSLHSVKLNVIADVVTAIDEVAAPHEKDSNWYTVDGRVLSVKPTAPGIYIHNGKKVIIR